MKLKPMISNLESCSVFKSWKRENKGSYLTHAFNVLENNKLNEWQIGYYDAKREKITVFELSDPVNQMPESDVFKEEKSLVRELTLSMVKVDYEEALTTVATLCKKKYPKIAMSKVIVILQHLESGQVWNITVVSVSFDVLNIKIDAGSGKVLEDCLKPLFEFSNNGAG